MTLNRKPTRAWRTRHWGALTGLLAPLRPIFDELGEFLARPSFLNGIEVGDGTAPTKDPETGVVIQPPVRIITSVTLDQPPQAVVDALDVLDLRATALETDPIDGTRITDDSIQTRQLAANAVTAENLAAVNLSVGKFIRSADFQPGVSGWAIDGDGDVEFNSGTFRGLVEAGAIRSTAIAFEEYPAGGAPGDDVTADPNALVWTQISGVSAGTPATKFQKTEGLPLNMFSLQGFQTYGGPFVVYQGLVVGDDDTTGGLFVLDGAPSQLTGYLVVDGGVLFNGFAQLGGSTHVGCKVFTWENITLGSDGQVLVPTDPLFSTAERRVMQIQAWEYENPTSVKPLGVVRASGTNIRLGTGAPGAKARCTVTYSQNNMAAG